MFRIKLFLGALALIGASGVMACDCGTNGTTTRVSEATTNVVTQRSPAADTSYSHNYESSGVKRATAEDRSYPRRSVNSYDSTPTHTFGNGIGRGRKENLP